MPGQMPVTEQPITPESQRGANITVANFSNKSVGIGQIGKLGRL
jgi:hypothetical protein